MKRDTIAKGVYKDKFGKAIVVSVNGKPREFRHALLDDGSRGESYKHWSTADLITERKNVRAREQLNAQREAVSKSTFAADVTRYLNTLSGTTKADAKNLLTHWDVFNARQRRSLTAVELRAHAATWACKPSTFNHRRQVLISLYKTLDGPHAKNPAKEIPKAREQHGAPKALAYSVIAAALKQMPVSQSKARLMLMAYTGLPQRAQSALDARVPAGATLRWRLRFAPQPARATLRFHDGRELVCVGS